MSLPIHLNGSMCDGLQDAMVSYTCGLTMIHGKDMLPYQRRQLGRQ